MIEFFNAIIEWITVGIYDFVVDLYAWLVIKIMEFKFAWLIAVVQFSWDVAKEILTQLNISQEMTSALSALPAQTVEHLNFFNVINGINILLNALVTRIVMRFTGL